ncbi:MAG: pantoate--beta-alanine ligase [Clostridiales Family XIII bacterium]|nr:pantoate--beta-alanine ligase [Clostridia bacterium]MDY3011701.1 pantoate--beta-alanine ligase [Clostridiales Family XIII bacterium]
MKIAETKQETRKIVKKWKKQGLSVGLVPTMGFLHEGHESLILKSAAENDKTVVSVFVNPMQFGKNEDLEDYPRDFERDCSICRKAGADLIFHPCPQEMYPADFFSYVNVDRITEGLCGSDRPGHFRGVCTVVSKLFHIITPDRAYFGQKDAQQLAVIKKMVQDLDFDLQVIGCPTVREADGLAKSSRNTYLSPEERKAAAVIHRTLEYAKEAISQGQRDAGELKKELVSRIEKEPLAEIDYIELVDGELLQPVKVLKKPLLIAAAVRVGKTRLIDNYFWE